MSQRTSEHALLGTLVCRVAVPAWLLAGATIKLQERSPMLLPSPVRDSLRTIAGAMGKGGDVFVLDMGEPVKILDLAHRMVQLAGLAVRDSANPSGDIEIAITGLRPGEKLYEELLIGDNPQSTLNPRIMKAHEDMLPWDVLQDHLSALRAAAVAGDDFQIRAVLAACVQGFSALQAAPVASP